MYIVHFEYTEPEQTLCIQLRAAKNDHYVMVSTKPGQLGSDRAANSLTLRVDIEIEGWESSARITFDRAYPRAAFPDFKTEWDTPRIEFRSFDAEMGNIPWEARSKSMDMVCFLADYLHNTYLV